MLLQLGLAVLVGLAIGATLMFGVASSRSRALGELAEQVSTDVEPYLRRRAAEVGLDPERPVWTARHTPAERVTYSTDLARKLSRQARGEDPAHSNTALAQTVPVVDSSEVTAPRTVSGDGGGNDKERG